MNHPKILPSDYTQPIDDRRPAGGPLRVGQIVRLYFESRVVWANGEQARQFLDVMVTARHRDGVRYRGELIETPNPNLFTRDELRIGQPIAFCFDQCLVILPKPQLRPATDNPFLT
jgi:hypothetical protein